MSIFNTLLKCLVVATVITPAAVTPAVAGCCGAHPVSGDITVNQGMEGNTSLTTTDTVTNTSMQMLLAEDNTWTPNTSQAPNLNNPDQTGQGCSGEVF